MTTNDSLVTPSKTPFSIQNIITRLKGYFLDAAGIAGVVIVLLSFFQNDAPRYMYDHYWYFFFSALFLALVTFFIKVFFTDYNSRWRFVDLALTLLATAFMWFIINATIIDSSKKEQANTERYDKLSEDLKKLESGQKSHAQKLKSMNQQLVDLTIKLEELESKQNLDKVEP